MALRRLLAVLTIALLAFETSGVVGAMEVDPLVHCCCGVHDSGHRCHCPSCPGTGALRIARRAGPRAPAPAPRHARMTSCHGRDTSITAPSLTPLMGAPAQVLEAPVSARPIGTTSARRLVSRTVSPRRPPP